MTGEQIPPKPDTTGMSPYNRNQTMHNYYEANKPAILADLDAIGEAALIKKWGISESGWKAIAHRWMPDLYPKPTWLHERPKGKDKGKDIKGSSKDRDKVLSEGMQHVGVKLVERLGTSESGGEPPKSRTAPFGRSDEVENELDYLRGWYDCSLWFLRTRGG